MTDEKPALQLYSEQPISDKFYLSGFLSNVDFGPSSDAHTEFDAVLGYRDQASLSSIGLDNKAVDMDIRLMSFMFLGDSSVNGRELRCFFTDADRKQGKHGLDAVYGYSDNWSGTETESNYFELGFGGKLGLAKTGSLSKLDYRVNAGRMWFQDDNIFTDYTNYGASISGSWQGAKLGLQLSHHNEMDKNLGSLFVQVSL